MCQEPELLQVGEEAFLLALQRQGLSLKSPGAREGYSEGIWSRQLTSSLPVHAKPPHYPPPRPQAANMALLDYALLTVSGLCDSVMRPLSTSENSTRLGRLRYLWTL